MIFTTKCRYAVSAMLDLFDATIDGNVKAVSLLSISQRQNISLSYLEQIFASLRKAKIVDSVKGPGGGYVLKKNPDKITILEIISAIGEEIKITACANKVGGCNSVDKQSKSKLKAKCKTHNLWLGLENQIDRYLGAISLEDLSKNLYHNKFLA